ncbi:hypothetical protein MBLNU230_g0056t1 [Neophaeotheca triangularis]
MDKVSTPPSPKAEESLIPFYMALARAKQPSPTPDPLYLHVEAALDIEGCIDDCNSHAATLIAEAQHQLSLPACVFLPADYDVTTDDKLSDPRRTKLSKMVIENGDRALAASQKTFGRVMGLIDKHQTEGLEALSMPEEDVVLSPSPPAPQTPRVSPTPKPSKLPKRSSSQKSAVPVAKGKPSPLSSRIPVASH